MIVALTDNSMDTSSQEVAGCQMRVEMILRREDSELSLKERNDRRLADDSMINVVREVRWLYR